jgi:hypothetical protein
MNSDGRPDLVVANNSLHGILGTVSVLLGNGNGTFQSRRTFPAGSGSWFATVADIDGDGKADVVVSNLYDATIGVMSGNGDGTLALQHTAGVASSPNLSTVADFNGDGAPDIAVVQPTFLGVILNQSLPAVDSINRTTPTGPNTGATSVTFTVRFNKTVTGVDPTDFAVVTGGSVTYTNLTVTPISGSVYSATVSGISGSGTLGLNLVDNGSIHDLAGQPLVGGAAAFQPQMTFAAGSYADSVIAADVSGDGKPDLIAPNYQAQSVSLLLGNGNGTFQAPRTLAVGLHPYSLAAADINGDGKPDVVVANRGYIGSNSMGTAGTLSVLLGNGNGTFQTQRTFSVGQDYPNSVAVADINGDGKPDLVVNDTFNFDSSYTGLVRIDHLRLLLGNGNGTFQAQQTFFALDPGAIVTPAVSNVNGDGKPDLVFLQSTGSGALLDVLLGNGNGTFQATRTFDLAGASGSLSVGDVSGDGIPDAIIASYNTVSILLGNGNGTFQSARTFAANGFNSSAIADINGDGISDLTIQTSSGFGVILGKSNGTFQAEQTFATSPPNRISVADVNGDGFPDVLASYVAISGGMLPAGTSFVGVRLGMANGNFTGQVYTIVPVSDTITGSSGNDSITLTQDADGTDIDWTMGAFSGLLPITDPNGLTINGNGVAPPGTDIIVLNYGIANKNPLPNTLHLNGKFTVNNLSATNPLANKTLEISRRIVFISYNYFDPLSLIQGYLKNGYNNGGWNGTPNASTGVITSVPAANNAAHTTAIGYADSADGLIAGQPANTIELKYTIYGDTTLTGTVGFNDFTRMTQHWNQTTGGAWDTGDFNYDGSVNSGDFTLMTRTYNTSLGNQAVPAISPITKHARKQRR